jgi:hypothetical protein
MIPCAMRIRVVEPVGTTTLPCYARPCRFPGGEAFPRLPAGSPTSRCTHYPRWS